MRQVQRQRPCGEVLPGVRLADRGADISEIEAAFTEWNAKLEERVESRTSPAEPQPISVPATNAETT